MERIRASIGACLAQSESGKFTEAVPFCREALAALETRLGSDSSDMALLLSELARSALTARRIDIALPYLQRVFAIYETALRRTVTETNLDALLSSQRLFEDTVYGLVLSYPNDRDLARLALSVALLRKGRAAEEGSVANRAVLAALKTPAQRRLGERWQEARQQREGVVWSGPGQQTFIAYQERIQALTQQIAALEAELLAAAPDLRALQPPLPAAVVHAVARKLAPTSALVEVVLARPQDYQATTPESRWGEPHYVALLLLGDERVTTVDLGPAAPIDDGVATLLVKLQDRVSRPQLAAQALYRRTFGRLLPLPPGTTSVYLSLDGSLQQVPFAALHDGADYLLGRYRFTYLTSGRDLLREPVGKAQAAVIVANPDYQLTPDRSAAPTRPKSDGTAAPSLYARLEGVQSLPGTQREAEQIKPLIPGVRLLLGKQATEAALLALRAPRVLHIATHGVFIADSFAGATAARGVTGPSGGAPANRMVGTLEVAGPAPDVALRTDNPLSRSALLLAGAAKAGQRGDSRNDGLVTAEEVRSMNLWGTQLVVLSACESGRGSVQTGQGVYGLRRAFFVAGAETLVVSLWQIADQETGTLMIAFYTELQKRHGRVAALQAAMQKLAGQNPHPYYWAPFVALGSDGPLR